MKRLVLIALVVMLPLSLIAETRPKQKRRYTIRDLDAQQKGATSSNKFDEFLHVVATLGLFYWWPGGRITIRSK